MRSKRRGVHGPSALALLIAALSCSDRDANISCSPTPSCSLHSERFAPADDDVDAGPRRCDPMRRRCRAEHVTAGGHHGCAIARAGELLCWGNNDQGQRGVEPAEDAGTDMMEGTGMSAREGGGERDAGLSPALVQVEHASAGGAHTCALTDDGRVHCWGRNVEGQVDGEASEQPVRTPRELELPRLSDVCAGGMHSCALSKQGVLCWGDARYGQVGRVPTARSLPPELVPGTEDAVEVACGARHSCARLENGSVLCWGELVDANDSLNVTAEPQPVPGLRDAVQISAGAGHSCALREGGHAVCWGRNESGQLGDGTRRPRGRPAPVLDLEQSLHISAGGLDEAGELVGHGCAQTKAFNVRCWGRNAEGQLGDGTAQDRTRAVLVLDRPDEENNITYLDEATNVAAGGRFSCNLDQGGPVYCWGDNRQGELGLRRDIEPVFGRPLPVKRFTR